jgi:ABC-type transporter Mla subunit MlaD
MKALLIAVAGVVCFVWAMSDIASEAKKASNTVTVALRK